MKTYHNSPLLYEEGFSIIINEVATPIENSTFYYFDYDKRSHAINMDFPHFHSFYELMILLSPKAYHFVVENAMISLPMIWCCSLHRCSISPNICPARPAIVSSLDLCCQNR